MPKLYYNMMTSKKGDIVSCSCPPEPYDDCECDPDEDECECGSTCMCVSKLTAKYGYEVWRVDPLWASDTDERNFDGCGSLPKHKFQNGQITLLTRIPPVFDIKITT